MSSQRAAGAPTSPMRFWRVIPGVACAGAMMLVAGHLWIVLRTQSRIHNAVQNVPATEVALVLGTSDRVPDGGPNPFFAGRISAAAELYHAGKVRRLLLSGANHSAHYNEPIKMRAALLQKGVPAAAMTLDEAGFRTLDSAARAKQVFGVATVTIVTDDFHAPRAVLLARHFGIDAHAYCSRPVSWQMSKKTRLREIGARVKALLELYVIRIGNARSEERTR